MQLAESTGVSVVSISQLMVFARFCFGNEMQEELLSCESVEERHAQGHTISTVNDFN